MILVVMVFGVVVEGTEGPEKDKNSKNIKKTSSKKKSSSTKGKDAINGTLDFHTKMLLVTVSIFMSIFVLVLLIIGHFTWFADIRKRLEEEWEEELKAEEEKRVAKAILSEMNNPFEDEEMAAGGVDDDLRRRESVDSVGCARGRCVPPHHSILCPNNPNVPSLTDPFTFNSSPKEYFEVDPIDYRNRPSTEWMNLDSSVKVSEPTPVREMGESTRMYMGNNFFSTGYLVHKPLRILATPDPEGSDLENGSTVSTTVSSPTPVSPQHKFDISKLDML